MYRKLLVVVCVITLFSFLGNTVTPEVTAQPTSEIELMGAGPFCANAHSLQVNAFVWAGADEDGHYEIFITDVNDPSPRQITNTSADTLNIHPVFSPDCSYIAFSSNGNIFVTNPEGTMLVQTTRATEMGMEDYYPFIAPDGRLFMARKLIGGALDIWIHVGDVLVAEQLPTNQSALDQIIAERNLTKTDDVNEFQPFVHPQALNSVVYVSSAVDPDDTFGYAIGSVDRISKGRGGYYFPHKPIGGFGILPFSQAVLVSEDRNGDGKLDIGFIGSSEIILTSQNSSFTRPYAVGENYIIALYGIHEAARYGLFTMAGEWIRDITPPGAH